jgi:hypothetical protein
VKSSAGQGRGFPGKALVVLALFCAAGLTDAVHARIPPTTQADLGEAFVPNPTIAKVASLGFDAVIADYYWLTAVQAIGGDTVISHELGVHLGKLIDLVTTLDPWVDHPYRFAGIWLTESEENVRTANRLLRRGIEYHPDDWRTRFYLGFNHFFYLMENDEAADIIEAASGLPGAPPYFPRLVARLRSSEQDLEVTETFLIQLITGAKDEVIRAGYQAALDEIEVEKKARFLEEARAGFVQLNGRDIESVEELVMADKPVLSHLPSPEPESLPAGLRRGSRWGLDPLSGRIVSSYYGFRYEVHFASWERKRAEAWHEKRAGSATDAAAAIEGSASVGDEPDSREGSRDGV